MVRDHRGRDWSVATKDCPDFLGKFYHLSGNPKIQKSSIFKSHKSLQGFLKKNVKL